MKSFTLFLLSACMLTFTACSNHFVQLPNGNQLDKRLIGVWTGHENDQQMEGVSKAWEMNRSADGTFIIDFEYNQYGETFHDSETGRWWVANGKFHEYHDISGNTDIYNYEILNENQVKFKSEMMSAEMNNSSYEFVDTRKIKTSKIY